MTRNFLSKRARKERALATERRLAVLQSGSAVIFLRLMFVPLMVQCVEPSSNQCALGGPHDDAETIASSDEDCESFIRETDQERRRMLLDSVSSDAGGLRVSRKDFADEFILPSSNISRDCLPSVPHGCATTSSSNLDPRRKGKAPRNALSAGETSTTPKPSTQGSMMGTAKAPATRPLTHFATKSSGSRLRDGSLPRMQRKAATSTHGHQLRAAGKPLPVAGASHTGKTQ